MQQSTDEKTMTFDLNIEKAADPAMEPITNPA